MGRTEARVKASIWENDGWRALSIEAQHLYQLILTQPTLSFCGVISLTPKRWAAMAKNLTGPKVLRSISELVSARYLIVDDETEEVLVRTLVRHDPPMKTPQLFIAMTRDYAAIQSQPLRQELIQPLRQGLGLEQGQGLDQQLSQRFPEAQRKGLFQGLPQRFVQEVGQGLSARPHASARALTWTLDEDSDSDVQGLVQDERDAGQDEPATPEVPREISPVQTDIERLAVEHEKVPRVLESEGQIEQAIGVALHVDSVLRASGGRPKPDQTVDLTWWALTGVDAKLVDQWVGDMAEQRDPPRTLDYVAKAVANRAQSAGIDLPEWTAA